MSKCKGRMADVQSNPSQLAPQELFPQQNSNLHSGARSHSTSGTGNLFTTCSTDGQLQWLDILPYTQLITTVVAAM